MEITIEEVIDALFGFLSLASFITFLLMVMHMTQITAFLERLV